MPGVAIIKQKQEKEIQKVMIDQSENDWIDLLKQLTEDLYVKKKVTTDGIMVIEIDNGNVDANVVVSKQIPAEPEDLYDVHETKDDANTTAAAPVMMRYQWIKTTW